MRTHQRPRRYVAGHWLMLLRPLLRYSLTREAFVVRGVGNSVGPVLCVERRRRVQRPYAGAERRGGVRVA
jgi:hypothetical protein